METSLLLPLAGFAVASSITPGPNNLMLLASGVNFGFRRSIPHMLGIGIGFVILLMVIGVGVGQLLQTYPLIYDVLKVASLVYMLWLAWKIANSGPIANRSDQASGRPMTFLQAVLFQWVNPKAWAMALTATAAYTQPDHYFSSLVWVALIFGSINLPCVSAWAGFGVGLRRWLQNPVKLKVFNITMAVLLVASFLPLVADLIRF